MEVRASKYWGFVFGLYGVLSLGFMAGMSIGGALFLLVSLVVVVLNWEQFRLKLFELGREPFVWTTIFLIFVCFLSLLSAKMDPPMGETHLGFRELKKFHHFLYPVFIGWAFAYLSKDLNKHLFWKCWGGMAIFSGLLAALQFFGGSLFPEEWLTNRFFRSIGATNKFHGQGLMFFHLSFASCFSSVAAIGWGKVLWPDSNESKKWRWFWRFLALAGFSAVFFSFSRIAFVALAFLTVGLSFLKRPKWGIVSVILIFVIGAGLWFQSESLRRRFIDGQAGIKSERVVMWKAAWEMFKERPHLGFGFGRSGDYTQHFARKVLNGGEPEFSSHAHNNLLDALAATGWLGLLAYVLWFGYWIVSAWKSFRKGNHPGLAAGALIALLAFQVNGLTQVNFWDGKSQHTLMIICGLIFALKLSRKNSAQQNEKSNPGTFGN